MRISDWSSDVCSSDLVLPGDDVRPARRVPCDVSLGLPRAAQGGGRDAALDGADRAVDRRDRADRVQLHVPRAAALCAPRGADRAGDGTDGRAGYQDGRSEEHTSELQSLMRISYAVFCLTKKIQKPL